ncbi:MAG TPA: glycosyltransferase family 39 protein, partial [Chloroflexota bacterium]|nr:glycosyltransferase family 39 protein [Chloroflexota bacterium]
MTSRTLPLGIASTDRQLSQWRRLVRRHSRLDSFGFVLFIIFSGFALRTWRLDSQSFWWDDAYSTMVANRSLGNIVATIAREDFHPPLHYFLFHYWLRLVGQSEFSMRFITVLAGVLTVAVASAVGYRLAGRRGRLLVAAAFAFSPYLYYYSQEARPFALTALFATLSYYCFLRAIESPGWRFWLGYTVALALGFYDLYYGLFVPLGCGVWLLVYRRGQWRQFGRWLASSVGAFVLFLPWVPIFIGRASVWSSTMPPDNGPAKIVYWSWLNFFIGLPSLALYRQPVPAGLVGLGALLTAIAVTFAGRNRTKQPYLLLMLLAFVVPLLAMAAVSAIKPIFHPRYAMPAAPGLYLLLGGVIAATTRQSDRVWRLTGGALAIVTAISFGYGLFHLEFDTAYARDNYRGALGYVKKIQAPGDTLVDNAIPPVWYYYHGPAPTTYFPYGAYGEANVVNELNAVTAQHPRLWYVENVLIPSDPDNLVETQLRLHAQLIHEAWFGAIRVQLWGIPRPNAFRTTTFTPVTRNLADGLAIGGYAVNGGLQGSETADVELQIETSHPTATDDGFWIALVDRQGNEWGRADVRPHDASLHLSSGWTVGETVIVRFGLPIAPGTPPGPYQLIAGAYRLSDLAGINVLDASNHPIGQQAPLGSVDVSRADRGQTDPKLTNQNPAEVAPGLVLAASDLAKTTLAPGDQLPVTLLWRSARQLSRM